VQYLFRVGIEIISLLAQLVCHDWHMFTGPLKETLKHCVVPFLHGIMYETIQQTSETGNKYERHDILRDSKEPLDGRNEDMVHVHVNPQRRSRVIMTKAGENLHSRCRNQFDP
jgi:hypothetical protein